MHNSFKGENLRIKFILLCFILLSLAFLSACGSAPAEEPAAPAEPAATEAPVEPSEPSEGLPVQYGQDSRTELYQHTDAKLKEMAASVAILVNSQHVKTTGDSVSLEAYTLDEMSEMGWLVAGATVPMCSNELFALQPAPGFCTGFLVNEDTLVTAGHCLQKTPCSDTSIVFGFYMESDKALASLTTQNVFTCREVVTQVTPTQENNYLDYAVIKLDRPTGRTGLAYATSDLLEHQDSVAVLGHPSGLPMKIASDAFVISNDTSSPFFVTNLDTFGSNSGSPVINTSSYEVEGVLVRGVNDYVLSDDDSCVQVNRCPENGSTICGGENATKMVMLSEQISESTAGINCFSGLSLAFALVVFARLKTS